VLLANGGRLGRLVRLAPPIVGASACLATRRAVVSEK
jgi:hypothetical protein